jgi:predicted transcriptional regulator
MNKMPNSVRKYIRGEKARIRREFLNIKEQREKINKLYQDTSKGKKEEK